MANIDIKGENIFNYVRDQLSLREHVISQVRSEFTTGANLLYNPSNIFTDVSLVSFITILLYIYIYIYKK